MCMPCLFFFASWSCFVVKHLSAICFLGVGPQLWKSRSFPSRNGRRMLKSVWVAWEKLPSSLILCLDPGLQGLCFAGPAMSEHWKLKAVDESCVFYKSSAGNAFDGRTWKWADWGFQGATERSKKDSESEWCQDVNSLQWRRCIQRPLLNHLRSADSRFSLVESHGKTRFRPGFLCFQPGYSPLHHHCYGGREPKAFKSLNTCEWMWMDYIRPSFRSLATSLLTEGTDGSPWVHRTAQFLWTHLVLFTCRMSNLIRKQFALQIPSGLEKSFKLRSSLSTNNMSHPRKLRSSTVLCVLRTVL